MLAEGAYDEEAAEASEGFVTATATAKIGREDEKLAYTFASSYPRYISLYTLQQNAQRAIEIRMKQENKSIMHMSTCTSSLQTSRQPRPPRHTFSSMRLRIKSQV